MEIKIPKEVHQHKKPFFRPVRPAIYLRGPGRRHSRGRVLPSENHHRPGNRKLGLHRGGGSRGRHRLFSIQLHDLRAVCLGLSEISIPLRRAEGIPIGKYLLRGAGKKGGTRL